MTDKQEQAARIAGISTRLGSCRLREIVASKKASLDKFTECSKHHEWVAETAKKLFNVIDVRKTGSITQADCKKIIRSLKYDVSAITEPLPDSITLDVLLRIISSIFAPIATPAQIRAAFEDLGDNGSVRLSELDNIKGCANLDPTGKDVLCYAEIKANIDE